MFRLPHSDRAIAFVPHVLGKAPLTIVAVDYDMGPAGVAYHDRVDADYHIATGGDRTEWNDGRTYRNDGVDIVREADGAPFVDRFEAGEWMQYTITAEHGGTARLVLATAEIGRASCRERVCPNVEVSVVAGTLQKKQTKTRKRR